LTVVREEELTVLVSERTGITCFLGSLEGRLAGTPFAARMRYTRTWVRDDRRGWRLLAAHASVV
jgi:hypothetical protein